MIDVELQEHGLTAVIRRISHQNAFIRGGIRLFGKTEVFLFLVSGKRIFQRAGTALQRLFVILIMNGFGGERAGIDISFIIHRLARNIGESGRREGHRHAFERVGEHFHGVFGSFAAVRKVVDELHRAVVEYFGITTARSILVVALDRVYANGFFAVLILLERRFQFLLVNGVFSAALRIAAVDGRVLEELIYAVVVIARDLVVQIIAKGKTDLLLDFRRRPFCFDHDVLRNLSRRGEGSAVRIIPAVHLVAFPSHAVIGEIDFPLFLYLNGLCFACAVRKRAAVGVERDRVIRRIRIVVPLRGVVSRRSATRGKRRDEKRRR